MILIEPNNDVVPTEQAIVKNIKPINGFIINAYSGCNGMCGIDGIVYVQIYVHIYIYIHTWENRQDWWIKKADGNLPLGSHAYNAYTLVI